MRILVLMSGGFHPFHPGHLALYQSAKKTFPGADVVIGATNAQSERPFSFNDKEILAKIAGVESGHFVEVKRQFVVQGEPNLESRIEDPNNTVLIFVRSEKDKNEKPQPWKPNSDGSTPISKKTGKPLSDYLLPYVGNQNQLEPMTKHAYIAYLPVVPFTGEMKSATEIRNMWPKLKDENKKQLAMQLYPATQRNSKLLGTVIKILDKNLGTSTFKEYISRMRPLIKEATMEQKVKILKLLKEAYTKELKEGLVLGPDDLVDVFIVGKDRKGNKVRRLVKSGVENKNVPKLMNFLDAHGFNKNSIVYGPSKLQQPEQPVNEVSEDYLEEK